MAPSAYDSNDDILFKIHRGFAIITLNRPQVKNAMTPDTYMQLAQLLRTVDANPEVFATVLTSNGDFFSAGADVKQRRDDTEGEGKSIRTATLSRLSGSVMDLGHALYRHKKLLIAALPGPAVGLSAALLGHFDFVYAVESAWIMTPFSTLSLVAEGGASLSFPRRMGISLANEALIFGKKISAPTLQQNGFFNKLFPDTDSRTFVSSVLAYLEDKFSGLDMDAAIKTKALIKATLPDPDPSNLREIVAGSEQWASGRPQEAFAKIANKTMRHKL